MSQYKCRDYWSTVSGFEEFHDIGSLCLGHVGGKASIVASSFQGAVRVYAPQDGGYMADHVVLEATLPLPVIQVLTVNFTKDARGGEEIAVLHPRKLVVLQIKGSGSSSSPDPDPGSGTKGERYSLVRAAEHVLLHTACNMVAGTMGNHSSQDCLAVQSMDGQLSLYSATGHAFTCYLPDHLLPGPLCYLAWLDALATVSSQGQLHVFKYRTLGVGRNIASAVDVAGATREASSGRGNRIKPDWSLAVGEAAVDLRYCAPEEDEVGFLLVLCPRQLLCVRENGTPVFMRRLDTPAAAVWPYRVQPGPEGTFLVQYLLALHNGGLMVFSSTQLMWSALLDHSPVAMRVADIGSCPGCVVTLDELGRLHCSYLGTTPPALSPSNQAGRDLNYQEVEAEMKQIQKSIKELSSDPALLPSPSSGTDVSVRFELSHVSRTVKTEEEGGPARVEHSVELGLQLVGSALEPLREVFVSLQADPAVLVSPHTLTFQTVGETPTFPTPVTFSCTDAKVAMTTSATIIVTYTHDNGSPHVMEEGFSLPLGLFCQRSTPSKTATHKITLETNKPAVNILSIFLDLTGEDLSEDAPTNACGFRLLPGQEVTVLASKTSERYRIQSDHLEALGLIADQLVYRLGKNFAGRSPKLQVTFSGNLPLTEYFPYVDRHSKALLAYRQCSEVLGRQAQQFRAIQKRLLTRFKDKTPTSLSHLDTLLDGTYLQLMALGERSTALKEELEGAANQLACCTALLTLLLRLMVAMGEEEGRLLGATLSSQVDQAGEQGWEERTDAAISHMLRTALAKTSREPASSTHSLEKVEDTQRLKRHIALFCDKIAKGGKLIVQQ